MSKTLFILALVALISGCGGEESSEATEGAKNLTFKCKQKIPEFTLGPSSNPSQEKLDSFCECVWGELDGWEKETSVAIAEGREGDISAMHLRAFPSRFGGIMESCGAMAL